MHRRKRIMTIITAAVLVFAFALPTLAASVSVTYSASLSLSSASTTTTIPSGYTGNAFVSGTWYYYNPSNPSETSTASAFNFATLGRPVTTSCSPQRASNPKCTKVYAASSSHSGSISGPGGSDSFNASRSI